MAKILQIFRDYNFSKVLKGVSEIENIEYYYAEDIEKAKEFLNEFKFDLIFIILDEKMEEIEKNNNFFLKQPIILISESINEYAEIDSIVFSDIEVIDILEKNISKKDLHEYVERVLINKMILKENENITIAIIDDSALELNIMRNMLKESGLKKVFYYQDAEEALIENQKIDLYVVDLIMPKISGREFMKKVRKDNPNCRIIAVSALDSSTTISNILFHWADDYITKPFKKELFLARLRTNVRSFLNYQELENQKKELQNLNTLLEDMVVKDGLTDLYNHKYIYERLEKELKLCKRYERKLSVLMFDIDFFKKINDNYGHQAGDDVLKGISNSLKKEFRTTDIIGRYGGEEFIVILPETELDSAYFTAERVRKSIENEEYVKSIKVTISGGVVEYCGENTALEIIGKADILLYSAKRKGRNQIEKANEKKCCRDIGGFV